MIKRREGRYSRSMCCFVAVEIIFFLLFRDLFIICSLISIICNLISSKIANSRKKKLEWKCVRVCASFVFDFKIERRGLQIKS